MSWEEASRINSNMLKPLNELMSELIEESNAVYLSSDNVRESFITSPVTVASVEHSTSSYAYAGVYLGNFICKKSGSIKITTSGSVNAKYYQTNSQTNYRIGLKCIVNNATYLGKPQGTVYSQTSSDYLDVKCDDVLVNGDTYTNISGTFSTEVFVNKGDIVSILMGFSKTKVNLSDINITQCDVSYDEI